MTFVELIRKIPWIRKKLDDYYDVLLGRTRVENNSEEIKARVDKKES